MDMLNELAVVIQVAAPLCAVIGFWYGVRLRLDRIEEILLRNNGIVRRTEALERTLAAQVQLCQERHHRAAANK